jgi:hypothetical protein
MVNRTILSEPLIDFIYWFKDVIVARLDLVLYRRRPASVSIRTWMAGMASALVVRSVCSFGLALSLHSRIRKAPATGLCKTQRRDSRKHVADKTVTEMVRSVSVCRTSGEAASR